MPLKFANLKPEQVIRALRKSGFYINESSGSRFDEVPRTLDASQAEDYYDCKLSMRGNPKTFCRSAVEEVSRNWSGGPPKARNDLFSAHAARLAKSAG